VYSDIGYFAITGDAQDYRAKDTGSSPTFKNFIALFKDDAEPHAQTHRRAVALTPERIQILIKKDPDHD
jgi:hypothetical protein